MKLIVQPGDGIKPLIDAIDGAKSSVEVVVFRFDRTEIERALANAVTRGVRVHALITYTNRGGEKNLRKLEMRLLAAGITVARTANDLARYHGKMMIVDRRELYLMAFNFTFLDIEHSRCFAIATKARNLVLEAVKLFEADTKRQSYSAALPDFVVSPANSRKQLGIFLKAAKSEILIYDPEVSDPAMIQILEARAKAGVQIKVIGRLAQVGGSIPARRLHQSRLHTRTIVRDGRAAFIGSQSLRELELDARREVGIIFREQKIVNRIKKIFNEDWDLTEQDVARDGSGDARTAKVAKKVAKAVAKDVAPIGPILEAINREIRGAGAVTDVNAEAIQETVEAAVKNAVKLAVQNAMDDATAPTEAAGPK